eukprot:TRINITY_DN67332_c8_g1_i1.p3 TRINITY_DN67332_c8_g1~~TRINITY_DN67332_c8_g1_i1.p3  ORF type:complete len:118 (-),score=11.88 TRINITY_DN67332_c8_g1_i1:498-851(-)
MQSFCIPPNVSLDDNDQHAVALLKTLATAPNLSSLELVGCGLTDATLSSCMELLTQLRIHTLVLDTNNNKITSHKGARLLFALVKDSKTLRNLSVEGIQPELDVTLQGVVNRYKDRR